MERLPLASVRIGHVAAPNLVNGVSNSPPSNPEIPAVSASKCSSWPLCQIHSDVDLHPFLASKCAKLKALDHRLTQLARQLHVKHRALLAHIIGHHEFNFVSPLSEEYALQCRNIMGQQKIVLKEVAALLHTLRGEAPLVVRVECYPHDANLKFTRDITSDEEMIEIVNDMRPRGMTTPGVRDGFA